jgi:hypothetical protein
MIDPHTAGLVAALVFGGIAAMLMLIGRSHDAEYQPPQRERPKFRCHGNMVDAFRAQGATFKGLSLGERQIGLYYDYAPLLLNGVQVGTIEMEDYSRGHFCPNDVGKELEREINKLLFEALKLHADKLRQDHEAAVEKARSGLKEMDEG